MVFAVGSQSHVSFYDVRCGKPVGFISSSDPGAGELLSYYSFFMATGKWLFVSAKQFAKEVQKKSVAS